MGKGFRKIDNELFKALIQADITRASYKVLLTIIHFTIGYHKEKDEVSFNTFEEWTRLARSSLVPAISELEQKQMITVNRDGYRSIYSLRDIGEWNGSLHTTKQDVKTLPSDPENTTKLDTVDATKHGSVAVPATPSYKDIRNKKTNKDKDNEPTDTDKNNENVITDQQRDGLLNAAKEQGFTAEQCKAYMLAKFNKSFSKALTKDEADQFLVDIFAGKVATYS